MAAAATAATATAAAAATTVRDGSAELKGAMLDVALASMGAPNGAQLLQNAQLLYGRQRTSATQLDQILHGAGYRQLFMSTGGAAARAAPTSPPPLGR